MPFFGDDFFEDEEVAMLTPEEQMLYLRLLWRQWKHGSMVDDSEVAALLIGFPGDSDAVERLFESFFESSGGRRSNQRLAAERAKADARVQAASASGKASAAARKADPKPKSTTVPTSVERPLQRKANVRATQYSTVQNRTEEREIPPPATQAPPMGAAGKSKEPSMAQIAWNNAWAMHRGGEYVWKQADAVAVNKLGKDHGVEAMAVKADEMLRDSEPFVWKNASPRLLANRWNQTGQTAPLRLSATQQATQAVLEAAARGGLST